MATPGYLVTCCNSNRSLSNDSSVTLHEEKLKEKVIIIISLIFAVLSSFCVIFIIYPKSQSKSQPKRGLTRGTTEGQGRILSGPSLSHIIACIVTADIMGNLGIVIRSSTWLAERYPEPGDDNYYDFEHIFCILTSLWVQYFFLCSVFWHLVYGLEAYLLTHGNNSSKFVQHVLGWGVPAAFSALGAWVIYQPKLSRCSASNQLDKGMLYLVVLLPVVIVIGLDIALFYLSQKAVKRALIQHFGRYSISERRILDAVQLKFWLLMMVLTVCWFPNLLNGIFINTLDDRSGDIVFIFLVLSSVVNPMLAFLDALVLWGWEGTSVCATRVKSPTSVRLPPTEINTSRRLFFRSQRNSETEPLLSFSRGNIRTGNTM